MLTETTRHGITIQKNGRKRRTTIEVIRRQGSVSFRTLCAGHEIIANTVNGLMTAIIGLGVGISPIELSDVMRAAYPAKA